MNNVPPVQQSVRRTIEQQPENAKEMGPTSSDSSEFSSRASTPKSPTPPKLSPTNTRWREDTKVKVGQQPGKPQRYIPVETPGFPGDREVDTEMTKIEQTWIGGAGRDRTDGL